MADLIDRQELLKHKGNCYDEEGHLLYAVGTGTILLMPTIDAEPVRHGYNTHKNTPSLFKCSLCGWFDSDTYTGDTHIYNYCPHCGAKMDEVTDEDS